MILMGGRGFLKDGGFHEGVLAPAAAHCRRSLSRSPCRKSTDADFSCGERCRVEMETKRAACSCFLRMRIAAMQREVLPRGWKRPAPAGHEEIWLSCCCFRGIIPQCQGSAYLASIGCALNGMKARPGHGMMKNFSRSTGRN